MSEQRKLPVIDGRDGRSEPAVDPQEPRVCRKLRTKNAFGTLEGLKSDWREGRSMTAVYWCLRTMETWGTDDRIAEPLACRAGRSCFAPPAYEEEIG